jgi:glycosyltransferase involved in cell wall biosynthesis
MPSELDPPLVNAMIPISVVIPAHNEESVIGRCLATLRDGAADGELEVVVVCNGCNDRTAALARAGAPDVTVVELAVASKAAALNAGDDHATRFPRIYLDADIELPIAALRATARALTRPGTLCAAPAPVFELDGRPVLVRNYYDVWRQLPYVTEDMVGTGVYGLSEEGRARFDRFPDLTADDQFVLQQFDRRERFTLPEQHFVVHPPTTLRGLLAIRRRAYRGVAELEASGLARHEAATGSGRRLAELARSPHQWFALITYVGISLYAKASARWGNSSRWERDDSARRSAAREEA